MQLYRVVGVIAEYRAFKIQGVCDLATPLSIDETQSPLLCSLVDKHDRGKRHRRVIPGDVGEQRSLRAVVSSLLLAQIPVSRSRSLLFQLPLIKLVNIIIFIRALEQILNRA